MKKSLIRKPSAVRVALERKILGLAYRIQNTGDGNFEKNGELAFARKLGDLYADADFVFFDIGANKGEYTSMILSATRAKSLSAHLFEPQKTCFKGLSSMRFLTLPKHTPERKAVILNNFGLSDENGEATLFKDADESGLASVHKRNLDHYGIDMGLTETISLRKASEYVAEKLVKKIHLIKIDVEGHEIPALSGFGDFLSGDNVDFIQFEYGGANLDSHTSLLELFRFFEARGFVVCKMTKKGLETRRYGPELENFMYQNYVAVSKRIVDSAV